MKKHIIIICLILSSFELSAQFNINIKLGGGLGNSIIFQKSKTNFETTRLGAFDPAFAFSYSIGSNINYSLNNRFQTSLGLLFINKTYNERFGSIIIYKHINNYFVAIPLSIKTKIYKKASINIGIVNNVFLKSSHSFTDGIRKYSLGAIIGYSYHISNKIELSTDLQTDITPYIYYDTFLGYQMQYNYGIMLSLSYKLFKT